METKDIWYESGYFQDGIGSISFQDRSSTRLMKASLSRAPRYWWNTPSFTLQAKKGFQCKFLNQKNKAILMSARDRVFF